MSIVSLRRPQARLADCCWLPRIIDKMRAYEAGQLPWTYRLALGHRMGIDGSFLRHFRLTTAEFLAAVHGQDDAAIERWFRTRPDVTPARIAAWNQRAPTLGAKGHPGYAVRQCVKWFLYPKSVLKPVGSLFEAIEQDEQSTAPPTP